MAKHLRLTGVLILSVSFAAPLAYGQDADKINSPVAVATGESVTDASRSFTLAAVSAEAQDGGETTTESTTVSTIEEEGGASLPFSFSINYYLYSDYVFRGINFSEYGTEGREKPNHQMDTDLSVDIAAMFGQKAGTFGSFGFGTFFEWFAAQKSLDPVHGGQNLQEVDYLIYWSYDIEPIATNFTVGYTWYAFPNASSINTSEWWISLEHNDAWMWKWLWPENEDGILNPSFFMAQDVGITGGGMWFEFGLSHDFEVFENLTLTPSWLLTADHRWMDKILGTPGHTTASTRLAYAQYGLTATYDISSALQLPDWAGGITLSGFLYFNDALGNLEDNNKIQDEFFGGMSVGWSFGD